MTQSIMFPGQGSQEVGMGRELFDLFPEQVEEASDIFGVDIKALCLESTSEYLSRTDNAQAAIFIVNALNYMLFCKGAPPPDIVLGHSVGQINALVAAGSISFSEGLFLVRQRGRLMVENRGGAMAAVMKLTAPDLAEILNATALGRQIDIANYNSLYQTVISGTESAIEDVSEQLQHAGAFVVRLKTSGAFHSRYMQPSKEKFAEALCNVEFKPANIRLICNLTGREIESPSCALAEHLIKPVKWFQSIFHILNIDENTNFIECGWGNSLSNILRYNRKEYSAQLLEV